jgi:hypothetical protein
MLLRLWQKSVIALRSLSIGTRDEWSASSSGWFTYVESSRGTRWTEGRTNHRAGLNAVEKFLSTTNDRTPYLGPPPCSLITVPTEKARLRFFSNIHFNIIHTHIYIYIIESCHHWHANLNSSLCQNSVIWWRIGEREVKFYRFVTSNLNRIVSFKLGQI